MLMKSRKQDAARIRQLEIDLERMTRKYAKLQASVDEFIGKQQRRMQQDKNKRNIDYTLEG